MAKFQSPLLGFNNNVRHRGRVFHIQTEDSGVNHPHIITHLFMDGGRILKSVKLSYAEHVGAETMSETVRGLMKDQHKSMIVALRDGHFDEQAFGGKQKPSGTTPAVSPAPPPVVAAPPPVAAAPPPPPVVAAPPPPPVVAAPPVRERIVLPYDPEPPLPPELEALLRDELPPIDGTEPFALVPPEPTKPVEPFDVDSAPPTTREPPPQMAAEELTLDFDALERDSAAVSPFLRASDLPPPPKNLFSKEAKEYRGGSYRAHEDAARHADVVRPSTPPRGRFPSTPPRAFAPTPANARPPSTRPEPAKPPPPPRLEEDLLREKSLDEVILSYLAEDLDPSKT